LKDRKKIILYKKQRLQKDIGNTFKDFLKSKIVGNEIKKTVLWKKHYYYKVAGIFFNKKEIIFMWKLLRFVKGKGFSIPYSWR
ncbi:MAG: hypothetical protein ACP5G8_08000, partial [Athalassotoga sp.]